MEKKTVKHTLRMSEKESRKLERWSDAAGIPKAEYVRQKIFGRVPQPLPTPAFWSHLSDLYAVHDRLEDGYIAWHGYQSFKPGEVTPELCHAIGVQTAFVWSTACP